MSAELLYREVRLLQNLPSPCSSRGLGSSKQQQNEIVSGGSKQIKIKIVIGSAKKTITIVTSFYWSNQINESGLDHNLSGRFLWNIRKWCLKLKRPEITRLTWKFPWGKLQRWWLLFSAWKTGRHESPNSIRGGKEFQFGSFCRSSEYCHLPPPLWRKAMRADSGITTRNKNGYYWGWNEFQRKKPEKRRAIS